MDDGLAGEFLQVALCNQGTNRRRVDWRTLFINRKTAVGIAVESKADIRALFHDEFLQVHEVLRIQWIGLVIREGAVKFKIQRTNIERQRFKDRWNSMSPIPLAASTATTSGRDSFSPTRPLRKSA